MARNSFSLSINNRYRTVVDQFNVHHRLKASGLDLSDLLAGLGDEIFVKPVRFVRAGRFDE